MENHLEKVDPVLKLAYEANSARLAYLGAAYKEVEPKQFDQQLDSWVGKTMLRCELTALINLLIEKVIITPNEYVSKATESLVDFLAMRELEHGIVITDKGIRPSTEEPGGPTNGN